MNVLFLRTWKNTCLNLKSEESSSEGTKPRLSRSCVATISSNFRTFFMTVAKSVAKVSSAGLTPRQEPFASASVGDGSVGFVQEVSLLQMTA